MWRTATSAAHRSSADGDKADERAGVVRVPGRVWTVDVLASESKAPAGGEEARGVSDCRRCRERGQTWPGSSPVCAFQRGVFHAENWNCATMGELRNLASLNDLWNDDQYAGLVAVSEAADEAAKGLGSFVVLEWYKHRGRTSAAWVLHDESPPTVLTLEQAEAVLDEKKT